MPSPTSHSVKYGKKKRKRVFWGKLKNDTQDEQVSKFSEGLVVGMLRMKMMIR